MTGLVFKIATAAAWAKAEADGAVPASEDDRRDGFIHLSAAGQLPATVSRHFAGQTGLWLLAVDAEALGSALRWEASRDGALFPHCYGPLPLAAVRWARPLDKADIDALAEAG